MLIPGGMGPIEKRIFDRLQAAFSPAHLELVNESHLHSVPEKSETHFRLVIVGTAFEGLSRVARQRKVFEVVKEDIQPGLVHAFAMRVLTPAEWASPEATDTFTAPACRGGSTREKI